MCTPVNCSNRSRPFGPDGCQVPIGNGVCGEKRTLDFIYEFKKLYMRKMEEIDANGGGDCMQEKLRLQQEWIENLIEQNEMLVRAVGELEVEATERVHMLEEKLQRSAQCICEVMNKYRQYDVTNEILTEPLEKIFRLENDQKNLLEFIRRIRDDNKWDFEGLSFYEISYKDLFGNDLIENHYDKRFLNNSDEKEEQKAKNYESTIESLRKRIDFFNSFGNVEAIAKDLKCKTEECETLRQSMFDMRHALTEEVASKHDTILQLKKEVQQLEEKCIQADKQTAFRDDIVKELRKEIKQLKQQSNEMELLKYSVNKCLQNVKSKLIKIKTESNFNAIDSVFEELYTVQSKYTKDNIYSNMESEIKRLNHILEIQNLQLKEQFFLNKILIQRLFNVNVGLEFLEERARSVQCLCHRNEALSLNSKIEDLEKQKKCLECNLKEDKKQLVDLESRFQIFLKNREDLKQKCKMTERKCKCLEEKNKNLATENENVKSRFAIILKDNEHYAAQKILLETELKSQKENMNHFEKTMGTCLCKIEELEKENKQFTEELIKLNEENRSLMQTLDGQNNKLHYTAKVTQDEVLKLHSTINELENNLQCTKQLQEEEEKLKTAEILKLKETVKNLMKNLKETEEKVKICKICKGRSKVGFSHSTEVQATLDQEQIEKQMELLQNREEIIKVQTDTLTLLQNEIENLKKRDADMGLENEKQYNELNLLRYKIKELEDELKTSEGKASNLQLAVDLYLNTINVLEASEAKYKIEIDQQKLTISNLQNAFVTVKQELENLKQKSDENELDQHKLISQFASMMTDHESEINELKDQIKCVNQVYEELQELNFDLEVEHCTSLQDVDILDSQLYKYLMLLKSEEDENKNLKNHLKKLQKQKNCYEEVVGYFRDEMNIMAEQLHNLQELLTISHASIHEENDKLQKAFTNVQCVNQQLSCQLKAAEQKLLLENQMNQLNESKICELERLISDKELDLGRHDRAILSIRQTLQCSLKQNEDLHSTIVGLNATIANLQSAIIKYENDNSKSKENAMTCQEQINACKAKLDELKQSLERKTAELCKLEMAYNSQNRSLKSAQMELKELKEKQREKQCHLKCIMGEMEDKLRISEEKYNKLMEEYKCLETKLGIIARRETIKQVEIQRYRQIVADLKKTLIDLNKNLTKKDYKPKCQNEICRRRYSNDNDEPDQDIAINCPCETEFYHTIVENLKKSVNDLQTKLNQTQRKNNELEAKCKCTEALVEEMSRSQIEKDKEYNELRQKLTEKIHLSQQEESRYLELAGQFERELGAIRQELEARTLQLNDFKNSAQEINSSRCMQLACAQEETNRLKEELNKLLRKHCNLNCENEKLHSQGAHLQSAVSNLEETNQLMKSQVEQYLLELQRVQTEKETLVQKNRELLAELRSLQVSHATVNKQQRYDSESLKALESEFIEMKNSRDEICHESKKVINYVKCWLQEQKKINEYLINKEKNYCSTIEKLRQENEELHIFHSTPKSQQPCINNPACTRAVSPPMCQSPWSLGSQGTSYTPSQSPCLNEECDWYSSNFRSYSEDDEEEDDWVSKVEDLAAQVRKTNKMWKNKLNGPEFTVTKDTK